ncbi:MAG TPA: mandelate racemase/muconate lactonizing enzyme family protein [Bryobacteraceae bacterium]|nr:mandelate racemase/muconate lactonizing enzyme family protein [Bryobacteraceae bacterium]
MRRRTLLRTGLSAFSFGHWPLACLARAEARKMKITRIRLYASSISRPLIVQSHHVITVETDAGITGVGEGGTAELIRDCAVHLIGKDPTRIEALWQLMYRGSFYPAGREKLHALGGLDMALWDILGKSLGAPVHQLLGGAARDHIECYSTGFPSRATLRETARACIDAGFRAFRTSVIDRPSGPQTNVQPFDSSDAIHRTHQNCIEIREGVGSGGRWAIDYHTRLDLRGAVRLSTLIEPLEPYFAEDLVRSENPGVYRQVRSLVKVPIAVGEQFGDRWDINELIENRLIDYSRVSLPNCGGITEFMKHAAICETHYVGLVPHFTGPVSEAALAHCCAVFSGPVLMEMRGNGSLPATYLANSFDFRDRKIWPNSRPGLGVDFNPAGLTLLAEIDKPGQPIPLYRRPDGSLTNW